MTSHSNLLQSLHFHSRKGSKVSKVCAALCAFDRLASTGQQAGDYVGPCGIHQVIPNPYCPRENDGKWRTLAGFLKLPTPIVSCHLQCGRLGTSPKKPWGYRQLKSWKQILSVGGFDLQNATAIWRWHPGSEVYNIRIKLPTMRIATRTIDSRTPI